MEYSYKRLYDPADFAAIYRRLRDEDLLWALYSEVEPEEWSEDLYIKMHNSSTMRETWGGFIDGELAGVACIWPFDGSYRTRCAEISVTAFRKYFDQAARLARGCLLEMLNTHKDKLCSFIGRVPVPNRHVLNMLGSLGFERKLRIPKLFWYTKAQKHVDGWIVFAEPSDIKATWEVE
jgi:hypothetical protein